MDLVLFANALDVLLQNHFHDVIPHFSPENRCSFVALVYRNCNYSASSFSATLSATSMTLSIS